ncbi:MULTISPECIES: DUF427 domain-containing protein [unclassified Streptomyces]|uniref:DUF427 domain-containing protein n=1 Tax=unclassified Streptomyces TaxID=2593676 RepID=UPI000DB981D5|nr:MULTISPECIES: DUF427 domain-containing protein [unclassified Streptomyces]MYT69567.1 DUF427 domain-containing protein [Streptomyces sp. SID8367]
MADGHTITIEQDARRVRVVRDGEVLADSTRALLLKETGCPERHYIPPEDVRTELLTPSDTTTYCPFKGHASYWSLPGAQDLVWAYEEPKPGVAAIKGHLCFYETQVDAD